MIKNELCFSTVYPTRFKLSRLTIFIKRHIPIFFRRNYSPRHRTLYQRFLPIIFRHCAANICPRKNKTTPFLSENHDFSIQSIPVFVLGLTFGSELHRLWLVLCAGNSKMKDDMVKLWQTQARKMAKSTLWILRRGERNLLSAKCLSFFPASKRGDRTNFLDKCLLVFG